jgi:hypothetical protein
LFGLGLGSQIKPQQGVKASIWKKGVSGSCQDGPLRQPVLIYDGLWTAYQLAQSGVLSQSAENEFGAKGRNLHDREVFSRGETMPKNASPTDRVRE